MRAWAVCLAMCATHCARGASTSAADAGANHAAYMYILCYDPTSGPEEQAETLRFTSVGVVKRCLAWPLNTEGDVVPSSYPTWSSSDPSVATVDPNGFVTAVANGFSTLTASALDVTGSVLLMVDIVAGTPSQVGIISPRPICRAVDGIRVRALLFDALGSGYDCAATWSSSDPAIATIAADGTVVCLHEGSTILTAQCGNASGTAILTVLGPGPQAVSVTGQHPLLPGETVQLAAVALDSNGQPLLATFSWASDDASIATVDQKGLVTATGYGGTSVWATAFQPQPYYGPRGSAAIQVGQVVATVVVSPPSASVAVGSTLKFSASALAPDGGTIPEATFGWDKGDDLNKVVSIDHQTGVVTGTAPGGPIEVLAFVTGPKTVLAGRMGIATVTITPVPH